MLARLPELVELDVLNCKKLVNLDALLSCPTLRRVSFLNCGGPFKLGLRERFEAHGFDALALDYA